MDESHSVNITTILVFCVTAVVTFLWLRMRQQPTLGVPGPGHCWPVIGHLVFIGKARQNRNMPQFFKELSNTFGSIFSLKLGPVNAVVLNSYDVIHEALVVNGENVNMRPNMTLQYHIRGGKGILWRNGDEWRKTRRLALSTLRDFGVGKKRLETRVVEEAGYLCEVLEKQNGGAVMAAPLIQNAVSNIICSVTFGDRYEYNDAEFIHIISLMNNLVQGGSHYAPVSFFPVIRHFARFYPKLRKNMKSFLKIREFVCQQLDNHRATFEESNLRDVIDVFIQGHKEHGDIGDIYSEENIMYIILDLFAAGTETTSTALSWFLLYMIQHPEAQTKCQEEIDKVIGKSRPAAWTDKGDLSYFEACLNEVQRLGSIVPLALSHYTSADMELGGFKVPTGTVVIPNLYSVHRDPKIWDDPEEFRPERWLGETGKTLSKYLVPFSLGPRLCLGEALARMELFLFATTLLQRFTFAREADDVTLDLIGLAGITMSPKPFKVRAYSR